MKLKKILFFIASGCMLAAITGCGESGAVKSAAIEIEDLDLSVEEVVNDGEREVMFSYTNNSDYTITYYSLRFIPKSGTKKEDFDKFKDFGKWYPDDWDVDYVFLDAEYGDDDAYEDGESEEFIKPGETSEKEGVSRNNVMYVRDIEIYNMMEPDILTIQYIDKDDKEHKINYDYKNKKYNEESMSD